MRSPRFGTTAGARRFTPDRRRPGAPDRPAGPLDDACGRPDIRQRV